MDKLSVVHLLITACDLSTFAVSISPESLKNKDVDSGPAYSSSCNRSCCKDRGKAPRPTGASVLQWMGKEAMRVKLDFKQH